MFDPKEAKPEIWNSSCPLTREAILAWFPNFKLLPILLKFGEYEDYPDMWNEIIDWNIGYTFRGCAWVTRSGRVWTCGWAKHEQLRRVMGLKIEDVERAGWMRVSAPFGRELMPSGYICNKVSPAQRAFAKRHNVTVFEMNEDDPIVTTAQTENYENSA